jgi:hypothetical protein
MHVVFCRDMDVASENSRWRSEPVAQRRARGLGRVSLGYVSLHEQRKVTRSEGAKALAVEVEVEVDVAVAVVFNNKQSKSRRAAEQAQLYKSSVRPWTISLRPLKSASRIRGDDGRRIAVASTGKPKHRRESPSGLKPLPQTRKIHKTHWQSRH